MKPRAQAVPPLNEEAAALASYLDALLGSAPSTPWMADDCKDAGGGALSGTNAEAGQRPLPASLHHAALVLPVHRRDDCMDAGGRAASGTAVEQLPTTAAAESGDQAVHSPSEPFDCLLLTVDGMTLALPIEYVRAVIPLPASLSGASPAHDEDYPWLIGECEYRMARIRLVDVVAMLTSGEMAVARGRADPRVVLMAGAEIGLVCDGTVGPVSVHPGQVHWRTAHTRRPWLAGIVTAPSCVLLDARALAGMVRGDPQTRRRGQTP